MPVSHREIRITRVFDAPRHLVFEAMTRPEHVRQWWGGLAFSGVYREIAPPERLVFAEVVGAFPDTESTVTAVFLEEGSGTRLTLTVTSGPG